MWQVQQGVSVLAIGGLSREEGLNAYLPFPKTKEFWCPPEGLGQIVLTPRADLGDYGPNLLLSVLVCANRNKLFFCGWKLLCKNSASSDIRRMLPKTEIDLQFESVRSHLDHFVILHPEYFFVSS